ncbi:MAG: reverse transcriptase domain-containing protein [Candidatus Sulfotelmatobacter sp.]
MPPASEVSPQAAILFGMNAGSALRTISDKEHLRKAWREISKRNMLSKGLDNVTIRAFKNSLDQNLSQISAELRAGHYAFGKLRAHAIKKSGTSKQRPLQIATVRDRVVMKSIALFIEPAFRQFNLHCSFAFIKGRGVKLAIDRIHALVGQGNKYYFEADIINFFGAVDREVLWKMFSRRVRHKSLLRLLKQCFELELEDLHGHQTEFQELFFGSDSGIPQGGVLSPMLANFYLYEFDRRMLERGFNLVRYADDFVVMCESLEHALQAHDLARATLKTLGLEIHALAPGSKSRIGYFAKDGLMFLGVMFEGRDTFPASKVVDRFKGKVEEVLKPSTGDSLFKTLQKLTNLITGWGKCYRSMKVLEIYLRLDEFVKERVESYLKASGIRLIGRKKGRHMKFLGVPALITMVEHNKNSTPINPRTSAPSATEGGSFSLSSTSTT